MWYALAPESDLIILNRLLGLEEAGFDEILQHVSTNVTGSSTSSKTDEWK